MFVPLDERLHMRLRTLLLPAVIATLLLGACGGDDDDPKADETTEEIADNKADNSTSSVTTTPPVTTTSTAPLPPLHFEVKGECTSAQGVLYGDGSGFTPSTGPGNENTYLTEAWYPDGTPYPAENLAARGATDSLGKTPGWSWECALGVNYTGDPSGTYHGRITDEATGRSVEFDFKVGPA